MNGLTKLRILLTENCNANCRDCFNKDLRTKKHMDTGKVLRLFEHISGSIDRIKLMGGEPTTHPDFKQIYIEAQKNFRTVQLFTNALNHEIKKIRPRPCDSVVYNLSFLNESFDFSKLLPRYRFIRYYETQVGSKTNIPRLCENIDLIIKTHIARAIDPTPKFSITLNCVENIFEKKDVLNEKWRVVVNHVVAKNKKFLAFDHTIPYCFWTEKTKQFMEDKGIQEYASWTCRPGCFGLIDANFNIRHCNQHSQIVGSILDKDGKFVTADKLYSLLMLENTNKLSRNRNSSICKDCRISYKICTGGCFVHKYI